MLLMYRDTGCKFLTTTAENCFSERVSVCGNKVLIFEEEGGEGCLVEMELARSEWAL